MNQLPGNYNHGDFARGYHFYRKIGYSPDLAMFWAKQLLHVHKRVW